MVLSVVLRGKNGELAVPYLGAKNYARFLRFILGVGWAGATGGEKSRFVAEGLKMKPWLIWSQEQDKYGGPSTDGYRALEATLRRAYVAHCATHDETVSGSGRDDDRFRMRRALSRTRQ